MPIQGTDPAPVDAATADIRKSPLYREAESLFSSLFQPGSGLVCDAADVSTNGASAVFCATMAESLGCTPTTRVGIVQLKSGFSQILTFGPNTDRCPRYSPEAVWGSHQ